MEDERICSVCGCVLREDEQTEIDGELICDSCAEEQTVQCDHCLDRIWLSDAITDGRTHLCEGCYDDHYRRCECCGRILHDDDVVWYNDYPYCESCYDRLDVEIEEYSYKPDPIFYGDGKRYFGVELEIDGAGKDPESASRIKRQTNIRCENIYCKSDGSLDDGFEIVTHPATLSYHMGCMYWLDILQEAVRLGYRSHIGYPKTPHSIRNIPLLPEIAERLRIYKAQQANYNSMNGIQPSGYVFTNRAGNWMDPRDFQRDFKLTLKRCGIREINVHGIRHTFATRSLESGMSAKALSKILGHANVGFTLDTYAHVTEELMTDEMANLRGFL